MPPSRQWRFTVTPGRILTTALLLLLLLIFASLWARNRALRGKIDREIQAIRARGEPVTIAELKQTYESIPPEQNAAPILLESFALLKTNWPKPIEAFAKLRAPSTHDALSEEELALARAFLQSNAPALRVLDLALEKPHAAFSLRWHWSMVVPHPAPMRTTAQLLALQTRLAAPHSPSEALRSINQIVALSKLLERDPFLDSFYARATLLQNACGSIEYLLNSSSRLELEQLDSLRHLLPNHFDIRFILESERVHGLAFLRPMTHPDKLSPTDLDALQMTAHEPRLASSTGLLLQDNLALLDYTTAVIALADYEFPLALSKVRQLDELLRRRQEQEWESIQSYRFHRLASFTTFTWGLSVTFLNIFERAAHILAQLRMTRLALLLEENRLQTGQYPPDLTLFHGRLPEQELTDPFTGSMLRYLRRQDGFTLYSLGSDKTDQQGTRRSSEKVKRGEPYDLPFTVTHP